MNLPNKLTISRIIMSVVIILLLLFPFQMAGIEFPQLFIDEKLVVYSKYLITGILFIMASLTDDAIADKVLVNSVLIILASQGFIHPIIPVVIIVRDSIVNSIKMIAASRGKVVAAIKSGKVKTATLMVGITLTLFYNLPFELVNLRVADFLLFVAAILSIISGIQYYLLNKHLLFED